MFEEIEGVYVVVFGDNIEANTNQLVELLNRISKDYPKILFIADNVHRTAGEVIFAAFNRIELGKIPIQLFLRVLLMPSSYFHNPPKQPLKIWIDFIIIHHISFQKVLQV
jgi:hypothetical protein